MPPFSAAMASEAALVEGPAIAILQSLGWRHLNLLNEAPGPANPTGRLSFREVLLPAPLRAALRRLNPALPDAALRDAEAALAQDRSAMAPAAANREVLKLLRDGVPVEVRQADGSLRAERARVLDWTDPAANDFLLASQPWVASSLYRRRPDAIGFVNGVPLLLCEWKAPTQPVQEAHDANLRDYRDTIPRLFDANGFVVLSNGLEALMGPAHAPFEGFFPWKRLEEEEPEAVGLEVLLRGACAPARFLDLVENFVLFEEARGGLRKVLARNHQVLGVNRAIAAVRRLEENQGRLGVFWHTQGSGKSLSMVMFAQKVLRRLGGNWSFVVVTDRQELDDQVAATFAATGALARDVKDVQAQSRAHLRALLAGQERAVFTLIHKFGTARGEAMPVLSERRDVIVITDEAHRSQYDQLAANMRRALPNAAFIGFTGTPLIAGEEERTREVFGDYVSIYDFAQSVADGATVPLYYESRKPELQLDADALREELDALLEAAMLDEEQEKRLQRDFANQYQLITRPGRLEEVAADLVRHFAARGFLGKAMFVAVDKATAVRMHDLAKRHWAALLAEEEARLAAAPPEAAAALAPRLAWMRGTQFAVVVSQGQNEVAELKAKGLDILPHRRRMQEEDLEADFKNPAHPLRLVFVCAMWITGFDVPSCSTVYLDKPMRNHTLMQTIARANRRAEGKEAGVVVDYVGVFRNLQKALATYAARRGGEGPIQDASALVAALEAALEEARAACAGAGVDLVAIAGAERLARLALIGAAVEALVAPDERRRDFLRKAAGAARAYKALLPDGRAAPFLPAVAVLHVLAEAIRGRLGPVDVSALGERIEALLDARIGGAAITAPILAGDGRGGRVDLSAIDFGALAQLFATRPRTAADRLRAAAEAAAQEMGARNPTRLHLVERLEKLVEAYNAGTMDVTAFFDALKGFVAAMDEEGRRAAREELTEAELAVFDLLTRPEPKLTAEERQAVKAVARHLLETLQGLRSAHWRENPRMRATVLSEIRVTLNALPEEPYPEPLWEEKVEAVWQHVFAMPGDAGQGAAA